MSVHSSYRTGEVITRVLGGAIESVTLPPINMNHLLNITVGSGKVSGFRLLPTAVAPSLSTAEITLSARQIPVSDAAGTPLVGVSIKLTPLRLPASNHDAFEARVEVLDSTGV
jgi:hypothetical protein